MGFRFISTAEFEALTSNEQLVYLSDAMDELERMKLPREMRSWYSLFTDGQQQQEPPQRQEPQQQLQQQQQDQQPPSEPDSK